MHLFAAVDYWPLTIGQQITSACFIVFNRYTTATVILSGFFAVILLRQHGQNMRVARVMVERRT